MSDPTKPSHKVIDSAPDTGSTGAGRPSDKGNKEPEAESQQAKGDSPTIPNTDIQAGHETDHIKQPFSVTEADGVGDGVQQDNLGAPGQGGDERTETPEERAAQHKKWEEEDQDGLPSV